MEEFDPAFLLAQTGELPNRLARRKIRAWVTSSWLAELVQLFGGAIDSNSELDDMLGQLERFSDRWDFRRMARERGALPDDEQR